MNCIKLKKCVALLIGIAMCTQLVGVAVAEESETESALLEKKADVEVLADSDAVMGDPETLFAAYVDRELGTNLFSPAQPSFYSSNNLGSRLTGLTYQLYCFLKPELENIAQGKSTDTVISIPVSELGLDGRYTAADLGVDALFQVDGNFNPDALNAMRSLAAFDARALLNALLGDCPLELYWYDKSVGCSYTPSPSIRGSYSSDGNSYLEFSSDYRFSFTVAAEFSASEGTGTYQTDAVKTNAIETARGMAQAIVQKYAGVSDFEKLQGYAAEICELVDYNDEAADATNTTYGNPWQLLWVFDGDPTTKVVCEGYAKAFQYLCELTQFDQEIVCYSVSGTMNDGAHMWNLVSMDDGKSYLVDVTNCDYTSFDDHLFLKGCSNVSQSGFSCDDIIYIYDADTLASFTLDELTVSTTDYIPTGSGIEPEPDPVPDYVASGICGAEGDNLSWTLDDKGVLTISGTGDMADFRYSEYAPWYEYRDLVESVELKDGVSSIGDYAFYNMQNLTTLAMPRQVSKISSSAFVFCMLAEISVDSENETYMAIDGVLFSKDGTELLLYPAKKSDIFYQIPEGTELVGNNAFQNNSKLEQVVLPDSVTVIGVEAFNYCIALTQVSLNEGLKEIGDSAFSACYKLGSIELPATLESIGDGAFFATGLTDISVSENSQSYCSRDGILFSKDGSTLVFYPPKRSDTSYTVPEGVQIIDPYALSGNNNLTEVVLPEGLRYIEKFACAYSKLASITIPQSLMQIDTAAFVLCDKLQSIFYNGDEKQWSELDIGELNEALANQPIHYGGSGHIEVIDPAVPATCATTGLTEGSHCSVCGINIKAPQETGVRIYRENATISNTTIDGDVYIGPNAVVSFSDVIIEGNLYVLGGARLGNVQVNEIYGKSVSVGYGTVFDNGTVYWYGSCSISAIKVSTYPIATIPLYLEEDSFLADQGKVTVTGATPNIATFSVNGVPVNLEQDGWFEVENLDVSETHQIIFSWTTVFGNTIEQVYTVDTCVFDGHVVVSDLAVAPTCTETGLTEGQHCGFCGEVLVPQQQVSANGHHFQDGICTVCGANEGATVSGTITSYGDVDQPISIRLMAENGAEEIMAVETSTDRYMLEGVPAGSYIVEISKLNHVTRSYSVILHDDEVLTLDLKICPLGDASGDGAVTIIDAALANSYARGTGELEEYALACADVSGNDGKVTIIDAARINAHARGTASLWE